MSRSRGFLVGALAIALVLAVAGSWWLGRSALPGAAGSQADSPRVAMPGASYGPDSFPLYSVGAGGNSVDDAACIAPVDNYGRGQPDWAEGFFWPGHDRFYINFTGQAEAHVAAIRGLVAADCAITVRIVPVSSATGRALQERITDDAIAHVVPGVQVNSVGFDPVSDRVLVGVVGPVTQQIRAEFESRYPPEQIELYQRGGAAGAV